MRLVLCILGAWPSVLFASGGRATAATEEQAKRIGKDARYIHFACHGLVNERRPLDFSIVLHVAQGMERFYAALARAVPKDVALQRTQQAAIQAGHPPMRWAAYQLYGDWR